MSATTVPTTTKRPGVGFEVLLGQSPRTSQGTWNCCIVSPGNSGSFDGTGTDNVIYELYNTDTAIELCGSGSFPHLMRQAAWEGNGNVRWFLIKAADDAAATTAVVYSHITGSATESKTMNWRWGDTIIPVNVTNGDTIDTIGKAVETAINSNIKSPVIADWTWAGGPEDLGATSGSWSFTTKTCGTPANSVEFRCDDTIEGITLGVASGICTGGSGVPDWDAALDVLEASSRKFKYIVPACATLSELNAGTGNLRDRIGADALASVKKRMQVVVGNKGTQAAAATFSSGFDTGTTEANEPGWRFQTEWCYEGLAPEFEAAARWCSFRCGAESIDPNVNLGGFGGVKIPGMVPPPEVLGNPTNAEIEAALNAGCSPVIYDHEAGACYMVLSITCKDTTGGAEDYRAMTTNKITVADYIADDLEVACYDQYNGFKIANDDADGMPPLNLAAKTTTPSLIGDFIYVRGTNNYVSNGLIEDFERGDVVTERNTVNIRRVDGWIAANVVPWFNQLYCEIAETTP